MKKKRCMQAKDFMSEKDKLYYLANKLGYRVMVVKKKSKVCVWRITKNPDKYKSDCKRYVYMYHQYKFCPYCGRKIKVKED